MRPHRQRLYPHLMDTHERMNVLAARHSMLCLQALRITHMKSIEHIALMVRVRMNYRKWKREMKNIKINRGDKDKMQRYLR